MIFLRGICKIREMTNCSFLELLNKVINNLGAWDIQLRTWDRIYGNKTYRESSSWYVCDAFWMFDDEAIILFLELSFSYIRVLKMLTWWKHYHLFFYSQMMIVLYFLRWNNIFKYSANPMHLIDLCVTHEFCQSNIQSSPTRAKFSTVCTFIEYTA